MNKSKRKFIYEAIDSWQKQLAYHMQLVESAGISIAEDEDTTPEKVHKFLQKHADVISKGLAWIDKNFKNLDLDEALQKVGFSLQIVPDSEWMEYKTDPTETSEDTHVVRVKESYLNDNPDFTRFRDECGWAYHELVHSIVFSGKMPKEFLDIYSPFGYPMNTDEIYAFGFQAKKSTANQWKNTLQYYFDKGYDDFAEMLGMLKEIAAKNAKL